MKRSKTGFARLILLLSSLLLVASYASPAVSAQDVPEEITFRISKYTCARDPGNVSTAAGNIPDYCEPTAGVSFTVESEDGAFTGSCTTDDSGLCSLMVPNEATVTVTEDTTTAPAGTVPRENPITTQAVTEFAGALFINLPAPGDDEPTELPDTGAGVTVAESSTALIVSALAATMLSGSAAVLIRRRAA